MSREVTIDGVSVPAAIAARFDPTRGKSPFSYTKPTPNGPKRNTRIAVPRVLNWCTDDESEPEPETQRSQSEVMPQAVHLQYNSPMGMYSKEAVEEQYVQQIGDGSIPLPAPVPERHFDPSKSTALKYIQESERDDGFGDNLQDKLDAVERRRTYQSEKIKKQKKQTRFEEPNWADYARAKSERARSRTPGAGDSVGRDWSQPPMGRESSKTPIRDDDARQFQEKTKTFVHDTKDLASAPYYAYPEFNQPNQRREYRETSRGYELGGTDYTKGMKFEGPGPYDYVVDTRRSRKDEKRARPGYEIGGTDYGTGYVAPGPYHGHCADPPRLRPHYSADPRAPVNPYIAPNIDEVDPHLLVGDTKSNMKVTNLQHRDDGLMGLCYRPPEGFKPDHRRTQRREDGQQSNTFCTDFRTRAHSVPRSSAPPEQRDVYISRQDETDKEVNVRTLLTDEALVPRKRETTPAWREKSLEKHQSWQQLNDPRLYRNQVFYTEPNWTRTVEQRKGAWEQKAWDTDARVSLPASAKVPQGPPPFWQNHAQQKQQTWQNAASQLGSGAQNYQYQTTTTVSGTGATPQQNGYSSHQTSSYTRSADQYQPQTQTTNYNTQSYNYQGNGTNADLLLNTGFNKNQIEYIQQHRDAYRAGGHGDQNVSQNYNQQHEQETRRTRTTTSQVQNEPITRTTTYSYAQQPVAAPPSQTAAQLQTSQQSTTHSVRETSQPAATNYSQQQHYQQRQETRREETTRQPIVQQQQQQWQQQQQHERREERREETIQKPVVQQQQWQQQQHHERREERREETVQKPVVQQQQWQQQQHHERREERREETVQKPVVQQQQWQQQQRQERREERREEHVQQPVIQQQQWQQQQHQRKEERREETIRQPVVQQQQWQQQQHHERREETRERSVSQPIVQQQQWQQQQHQERREETRERSVSQQPVVQQQWQQQQQHHQKRETREESVRSQPLQPLSNVQTGQLQTSEGTVDRRIEMQETLPPGTLSNTQALAAGSYKDVEGHDILYKRDLQTTSDPGRDMALLKEEERKVVESELEPGVISRHITTKYYKKKTVTDTTTSTQNVANAYNDGQSRGYFEANVTERTDQSYLPPNVNYSLNDFEKYESVQDYVPSNLQQLSPNVQSTFNQQTDYKYANEQANNLYGTSFESTRTFHPEGNSAIDTRNLNMQINSRPAPQNTVQSQFENHPAQSQYATIQTTQGNFQLQQNQHHLRQHQAALSQQEDQQQQLQQYQQMNCASGQFEAPQLSNEQYTYNQGNDTTTDLMQTSQHSQSSNHTRRSKSEPRRMGEDELWTYNTSGHEGKRVNIGTLLDDSALIPIKRKEDPFWAPHALRRHYSWRQINDPYVPVVPGPGDDKPEWARLNLLKKGAWEKRMRDWETRTREYQMEPRLCLPPGLRFDRIPQPFWTNRSIRAHNVWQNVADHANFHNHNTSYLLPHEKVSIVTGQPPQFGLHFEKKENGHIDELNEKITSTSTKVNEGRTTPNINELNASQIYPNYGEYQLTIDGDDKAVVVPSVQVAPNNHKIVGPPPANDGKFIRTGDTVVRVRDQSELQSTDNLILKNTGTVDIKKHLAAQQQTQQMETNQQQIHEETQQGGKQLKQQNQHQTQVARQVTQHEPQKLQNNYRFHESQLQHQETNKQHHQQAQQNEYGAITRVPIAQHSHGKAFTHYHGEDNYTDNYTVHNVSSTQNQQNAISKSQEQRAQGIVEEDGQHTHGNDFTEKILTERFRDEMKSQFYETETFTTEEELEPGIIARHVTTKYYKRRIIGE